jgi:prepilin-type N-terminal cleavage/methylation domain-containing protein
MILQTGKYHRKNRNLNKKGLTFVEVMVTLVILSVGIVGIFKSYLISLDRITFLTSRIYAGNIIDNRLSKIERMLRIYQTLPLTFNDTIKVNVGHKNILYYPEVKIKSVKEFTDVFQIDFSLKWTEAGKERFLSRSMFISDTGLEEKK